MRHRNRFTIAIASSICVLASAGHAQWVTFANQTAQRLPIGAPPLNDPALSINDPEQKAYAWGDLDNDGDTDLVCVRKKGWTTLRRQNVLFMNEGVEEGHALNGVLIDRTALYASASDAPEWDDPAIAGGALPDMGFLTPTADADVKVADVNNDGWLDVITACTLSDGTPNWIGHPRVYINLGEKNGEWLGLMYEMNRIPFLGSASFPTVQPRFASLAVGDVTGDGYVDLYFGDTDTADVGPAETYDYNNRLLVNDGENRLGAGYFTDSGTTRLSANPGLESKYSVAIEMADFNGDGALDIVKHTAYHPPQLVAISHNNPQNVGYFPDSTYKVVYNLSGYSVSAGDLNNDGKMDLVIPDDNADRYLLNTGNAANGTANFSTHPFMFQIGGDDGFVGSAVIADLNNDGWNDVTTADVHREITGCARRAHIYRNLGNAPTVTLQEQSPSVIPTNMLTGTHDIAVFDVDGDGWNDIVLGRCNSTQVWRNTTPIPGDTNGDHNVNVDDLLAVINGWGVCDPPPLPCAADLTNNGVIDVDDLLEVINAWNP
jgi:hypothetical protein